MTTEYNGLFQYLEYLQSLGVHICIKDYVGFLGMDHDFEQCIMKYLTHSNPYCMYIKSDKEMFSRCISMMTRLKARFLKNHSPICGVCHAGIEEYVVPIFCRGVLIGSVHAGIFSCKEERAERRISRLCQDSRILNEDRAHELYRQNAHAAAIDEKMLLSSMSIIMNCVSLAFGKTLANNEFAKKKSETVIAQNMILAEAMDFLHCHYQEHCDVAAVAAHCHCSKSRLSHLFKTQTGVSIPIFLNRLRIERAKELIAGTNDSVNSIAYQVGFNNPDYFCKVFAQFTGVSCSQYRKQLDQ